MAVEAALLRAAANAGVPVPEVVGSEGSRVVVTRIEGEAIPRRILRDERYAAARGALLGQAAEALARLHAKVEADAVGGLTDDDPLQVVRAMIDALPQPHPALELGWRWLSQRRVPAVGRSVVHGDFRLGNWIVDERGLAAVLDWELAHIGDPAEDLGWMCVRSWRFGAPLPAAGVGTREELLAAYAGAGGAEVGLDALQWWEAFGTLRWAAICGQQASRHLSGTERSVELAAIGRRICEVELDLLDLVAPVDGGESSASEPPEDAPPAVALSELHDRPSSGQLLEAVREWVDGLALDGRDRFLARVAARALETVRREIALGPALEAAHRARLQALGFASRAELAAAVREGLDTVDVVAAIRVDVVDKLRVADPGQLDGR
jgi:aminoglycoside phosphotransferase (APT) family kinase protein